MEAQEQTQPGVRKVEDTPADTRRGGDVRTLLSPKTRRLHLRLHGRGHDRPRRLDLRALPPVLGGVHLRAAAGTLTADLDGEAQTVNGGRGAVHPDQRASHRLAQRGRRGGLHRLPPRPAGPAAGHRATSTPSERNPLRRSAVTGVGVVAPGGVNREAFWDRITSGRTATRRITFFDPAGFRSQIAAEADFDPQRGGPERPGGSNRMDRYVQFAVAAAMEAVTDAGLDLDAGRPRAHGGHAGQRRRRDDGAGGRLRRRLEPRREVARRPRVRVPVPLPRRSIPSTWRAEVALKFGAHGPSVVVSTGCTSGIDAIGYGHQLIQDGEADIVISGASEIADLADLDGLLRPDQGDLAPQRRPGARLAPVRPRPRRLRHGRGRRGARPRGVRRRAGARRAHLLRGRRLRQPRQRLPHDRPASRRRWRWPRRSTTRWRRADIEPEDIDYINAHGSGTKQNDRHETAAYKQLARRPRLQDPDQLDQVDDRPLARRHRRDRDGRLRAGHRPRRRPADGELGEPRPRVRPRLHAQARRDGGRSTPRSRPAAASAASSRR